MKSFKFILLVSAVFCLNVVTAFANPIKPTDQLREEIVDIIGFSFLDDYEENEYAAEVLFTVNKIGKIALGLNYNNFNYGYDQLVQVNNTVIPNRIRGNNFSVIGDLSSGFGKLKLESELQINVQGDLNGYYFQSQLSYPFDDNLLSVKLNLQSSLPNSLDNLFIIYNIYYSYYLSKNITILGSTHRRHKVSSVILMHLTWHRIITPESSCISID